MSLTRRRGGRTPLNETGSTPVATRFGNDDLRRIDAAWPRNGFSDRSDFIRRAAIDKADTALDIVTKTETETQRAAAIARKHETRILTPAEAELLAATAELIGRRTPYAWGGGTITGPSLGYDTEAHPAPATPGFDAGSLAQYLLFRAFEITIPRTSDDQFRAGQPVTEPQAGDLAFTFNFPQGISPATAAVYLGRGCIADAGQPGDLIHIGPLPATSVQLRRLWNWPRS
ncbi:MULTISPECIES: C40 family peptidase [Mycolicibacter]|uniref:NlpC/P60 family protein n=2 Tax=Mycolicibacter TaxID=1073531 RepID=A0ABU5XL48_9MYCO|nr:MULTISPECIES: NlpC/P60 family protein [unclassified Mycolicibacter]MEB3022921.1 NlpC/P60 family protein [Mycolicibacter sp. MYC098]MEB3034984.1 NlpC/P60 family protein [Mycolicibacter sp. MYC340]